MGRFHRHDTDDGHPHDHHHDGQPHDDTHQGHPHDHHEGHPHDHHHDGHPHDDTHHGHPHDAQRTHYSGLSRGQAAEGAPEVPAHSPHGDHTGYATGTERISVLERIFDENDRAAAANRALFDAHAVVCLNLMSSPGAGKTTLLARTLALLAEQGIRAGVVEGDIETSIDSDRLSGLGAQISLLNTGAGFGGECHLDAPMVAQALSRLDLTTLDVVLIENVGNLVCPAEFDVGAHHRVMVYAVTEGEEKPLKYPVMFRAVDLVLVNKVDLLPYLDVDMDAFDSALRSINPQVTSLPVSARTGEGMAAWLDWLLARVPAPGAGRAPD
jgi:hydrogenase nickel incorporation protein HypB